MTMQIIKWHPMREVAHMHDAIMREWLQAARSNAGGAAYAPPTDVIDAEGKITLHLDLPGVALADVAVEWHQGTLAITGERARVGDVGSWQRMERPFGRFARRIALPDDIDPTGIRAHMDRGVLTVEIPRTAPEQPTRIPVTATLEQDDDADTGRDGEA